MQALAPAATLPADAAAREELKAKLSDRTWRLNNLYVIKDKDANIVQFQMNDVQEELIEELWFRNLVLKSRQHGITTFACVLALDTALFGSNQNCGLVFHKMKDAAAAFNDKILFAYDHLPAWLRAERPIKKRDMSGELHLANGSKIVCSVSHRGGTLQFLHVSEYGPLVSQFPQRAQEVASGAFNALTKDGICIIESTAMGSWGDFYQKCKTAAEMDRQVESGSAMRTRLDYKLFFFAWWQDPANCLSPEEAAGVPMTDEDLRYFDAVEAQMQCRLFPGQRAWYVKKASEQAEHMLREHPSTPEEAFKGSVEGAYYARELAKLEKDGRFCDLPHIPTLPVYTFWDIGNSDSTAIWVMQHVGPWLHFLRYYENSHEGAGHYANVLARWRDEHGYRYARHYLPHDAGNSDWSRTDNRTRKQVLEDMKIGPVEVVPRIEVLADGIEMTRQLFAKVKIDRAGCGEDPKTGRGGIASLRAYRKQFDEKSQTWSDQPVKSWANHGADAFRQCAQGYDKPPEQPDTREAERKRRKQRERRLRSGMTA